MAVGVLSVLFHSSKTGQTASRNRLLKRTLYNEEQIDVTLSALQKKNFVDATIDEEWVLSRDLESTTLYDLCDALKLSLGSGNSGTGWRNRLAEHLKLHQRTSKEALAVSLRDILQDA